MIAGWTLDESPFHHGEDEVHDRVGNRTEIEARVRRAGIRNYLTDQHREFFPQLPYLAVGSLDASGQPWATLRVGPAGFATTPDAYTLDVNAAALPGDPSVPRVGEYIATLGIQFHTGRRNRANGVLTRVDPSGFTFAVKQTFGNCHKYIQSRVPTFIRRDPRTRRVLPDAPRLSAADVALIEHADTFFVASAYLAAEAGAARGVDVSHKGGRPGFVRADDARTLIVPDYVGNSYYNTMGNFMRNPQAGLLFIDFAAGDLLYVAARAEVLWNDPRTATFAGALRFLRYHVLRVRRSVAALPMTWSAPQYAEQLAHTGTWAEVTQPETSAA